MIRYILSLQVPWLRPNMCIIPALRVRHGSKVTDLNYCPISRFTSGEYIAHFLQLQNLIKFKLAPYRNKRSHRVTAACCAHPTRSQVFLLFSRSRHLLVLCFLSSGASFVRAYDGNLCDQYPDSAPASRSRQREKREKNGCRSQGQGFERETNSRWVIFLKLVLISFC